MHIFSNTLLTAGLFSKKLSLIKSTQNIRNLKNIQPEYPNLATQLNQ